MKHSVWVAFDLGVNGDYEGMYTWLDKQKAKECGDNVSFFEYKYGTDLLPDIKKDIQSAVSLNQKSRVYLIHLVQGKMKGSFIFGSRRNAPWAGFAGIGDQTEDSDA
jgi:hypothetical protein